MLGTMGTFTARGDDSQCFVLSNRQNDFMLAPPSAVLRNMEKEYGKLTAAQFREFIGKLPELRQQRDQFGNLLADLSKSKFDELMVSGYNWSLVYENPFARHIAIALYAFNQLKWLQAVSYTHLTLPTKRIV